MKHTKFELIRVSPELLTSTVYNTTKIHEPYQFVYIYQLLPFIIIIIVHKNQVCSTWFAYFSSYHDKNIMIHPPKHSDLHSQYDEQIMFFQGGDEIT